MFCKWHPTPLLFRNASAMRKPTYERLSSSMFCRWGGLPPLLRDVGTIQKISTVARSQCVLIVVDGMVCRWGKGGFPQQPPRPPPFGNASALQETTYISTVARGQRVSIFVRVLHMDFRVYRPPKPPSYFLGTPVAPFCPFYFGVSLLKLNSTKKGTLIINGLEPSFLRQAQCKTHPV